MTGRLHAAQASSAVLPAGLPSSAADASASAATARCPSGCVCRYVAAALAVVGLICAA